jgi:hypothetical protein
MRQGFNIHFFGFFDGFLFLLPAGRPGARNSSPSRSVSGTSQKLPIGVVSRLALGNRPCRTQRRTLEAGAPVISETSFSESIRTFFSLVAITGGNLSRPIQRGKV